VELQYLISASGGMERVTEAVEIKPPPDNESSEEQFIQASRSHHEERNEDTVYGEVPQVTFSSSRPFCALTTFRSPPSVMLPMESLGGAVLPSFLLSRTGF